jgi:hypothetical protein
LSSSEQWAWVAIVVTIPIIFFGVLEMRQWMLRRRQAAVARRKKGPRTGRPVRGG